MTPVLDAWPAGTVAILSTVGDRGEPHAIPVATARVAGRGRVLLGLAPGRGSLARLRARPEVALAVIAGGAAFTAHGSATVLAEDLAGVAVVAVAVESVQDHRQPTFEIEAGVRWRWTDGQARERDTAVRAALEDLA